MQKLGAGAIVVVGFCLLAGIFYFALRNENPAHRDFIEYWAAERLYLAHQNPYDPEAVFQMERAGGLDRPTPEVAFCTPVLLFAQMPLGMMSPQTGLLLWTLLLFVCLALSLWLLWRLLGRRDHLLILLGFTFAPAISCLQAGQLGIFFLLAVTLFLTLRRSYPLLAGLALTPCVLKPHLFLPIFVVLVLWQIENRSVRVLAGFALGVAGNLALTLAYAPRVLAQYLAFVGSTHMAGMFVPTLGSALQQLVAPGSGWLELVPALCAAGWAAWFFRHNRARWQWMQHGMPVLLVCLVTAPYAFFTDETLLLPAVMAALFAAIDHKRSLVPIALVGGAALAESLASVQIMSLWFLWTPLAWLGWYLYATGAFGKTAGEVAAP